MRTTRINSNKDSRDRKVQASDKSANRDQGSTHKALTSKVSLFAKREIAGGRLRPLLFCDHGRLEELKYLPLLFQILDNGGQQMQKNTGNTAKQYAAINPNSAKYGMSTSQTTAGSTSQ